MNKKEKIEKLLKIARSQIGKPYKYGAYLEEKNNDEPAAFDCSSFIQFIFNEIGIELPRSSVLQAAASGQEISDKDLNILTAGDIIFYEGERGHYRHDLFPGRKLYIGHTAIFSGASKIIHACNSSIASGVVEQSIINLPKSYNIMLIKRFII